MKTHGFEHVTLMFPAGRLDAVRDFYSGLLGLPERPRPGSITTPGVWPSCGAVQLHFSDDPTHSPRERPHTALMVDGLAELMEVLMQKGYRTESNAPLGGRERAFPWDPFGNKLEFVSVAV